MSRSDNETETSLVDRLFAWLLYLLPHHLLSRAMHWLTRCRWEPLKQTLINGAIRLYRIDLSSAADPDPENHPSFNAFFTRALRDGARPICQEEGGIACPVDGTISQIGEISEGRLFQAKGHSFDLEELLGGQVAGMEAYEGGSFATIYLSPRDYHRIHMPLSGRLNWMRHVPGRLFSVSPSTTRTVPRLFARNERVVSSFSTEAGEMGLILVGAIFVSSMDTVWSGCVTPRELAVRHWDYPPRTAPEVSLQKGEEMGRFNMGSTVILLFPRDSIQWASHLEAGSPVRMGELIGHCAVD